METTIDIEGGLEFAENMEKFDVNMVACVQRKLGEWAEEVRIEMEQLVPVLTGRLQASIYAEIAAWVVSVGASATHAYFVERGTKWMAAQPYLSPALAKYLPFLEGYITAGIDEAMYRVGM